MSKESGKKSNPKIIEEIKKIFKEGIEKRRAALKSKETIWDYNPTEEEIKKICEEEEISERELITESRNDHWTRLNCLITLFDLRGKNKKAVRFIEELQLIYPTMSDLIRPGTDQKSQ